MFYDDYSDDDDDDAELREDQDELQAVLASRITISHSDEASFVAANSQVDTDLSSKNDDVLYSQGATLLFTACEETRWTDALDLIEHQPQMITQFVKSTGTANTTFGWALWRRLPIHEACRRQAPAWIIASLISGAPESIKSTTQFGELPLHLAVEMGASPEVINLLIVSFWGGLLEKDNSGRIPLELLDKSEGMTQSDYTVIHDCLDRSTNALKTMQTEWEMKFNDLQSTNKGIILEMEARHNETLAQEKERLGLLEESLLKVKGHVDVYKEDRVQLERKLGTHASEQDEWKRGIESREETIQQLKTNILAQSNENDKLNEQMKEQETLVLALHGRIYQLEQDLVNITQFQINQMMPSLTLAQANLNSMMDANHALQGKLIGQTRGFTMLLQQRGISLPPPPPPTTPKPTPEKFVQEIDNNEVSNAAAMSAMRVLDLPEEEEEDDDSSISDQNLD